MFSLFTQITYVKFKINNKFNKYYKPFRERSSSSRVNRQDVSFDFFIVNFDNKREIDGDRLFKSKNSKDFI